ncbi:MAG: acylphosphatase [Acidobacteria bacterium]|nr:acylphosphatase [Acidobacteriota bacterium]MBI3655229.1 acylphosphatase [Acidobacteriota bacterium]
MKVAHRLFISGIVQGVGFRYFVYKAAQRHYIKGWVRNLADGRVEVTAEGEDTDIRQFVADLRRGPPMAQVENIEVKELTPTQPREFSIK